MLTVFLIAVQAIYSYGGVFVRVCCVHVEQLFSLFCKSDQSFLPPSDLSKMYVDKKNIEGFC